MNISDSNEIEQFSGFYNNQKLKLKMKTKKNNKFYIFKY